MNERYVTIPKSVYDRLIELCEYMRESDWGYDWNEKSIDAIESIREELGMNVYFDANFESEISEQLLDVEQDDEKFKTNIRNIIKQSVDASSYINRKMDE